MQDPTSEPMTREAHRAALAHAAGPGGTLEQVGDEHLILTRPGEGTLLVTFDSLDAARARPGGLPIGSALAAARGWATLDILADGQTWFRCEALHDRFDALADEGAFDAQERVLFAGGGMGGYGAAAFSVACPGATVLAVQPVATLARDVAGWERRFRPAWALDFGGRYGDASRLVAAAGRVLVVTDPGEHADAMHASLFRGEHVIPLPAPRGGRDILRRMERARILNEVLEAAVAGTLDAPGFARLWRARRQDPGWLAGLLRAAERADQPGLAAIVAARAVRSGGGKTAARRLDAALSRLAERGQRPPAGLADEASR